MFTLHDILTELARRKTYGGWSQWYFTESNTRELYPKHWDFFDAGATHRQRLMMAANRVGKTLSAGCETTMHLTGDYHPLWAGKTFDKPTKWWVIGKSSETTRQILQVLFLGPIGSFGTGLIPLANLDLDSLTDAKKAGTSINTVRVKHRSGGFSTIEFKSADQGRQAFEGTERSIFLDEEAPYPIYTECLLRCMTGDNILITTFTPLQSLTELVLSFLGSSDINVQGTTGLSKHVTRCTWDDVPHLSEKDKLEMMDSIPSWQRDARTKGVPQLGSGAIYPYPESTFVIPPFELPKHFARAYGFDVGRNTAVTWLAHDRDANVFYLYSEHFQVEGTASSHAHAIQARGKWLKGAIDSAARGRSATDGQNLFQMYQDLGLNIQNADKAVESGIQDVCELLQAGRLKVFSTCTQTLEEFRLYRREDGKVLKVRDHLMDAMRYAVHTRDKIFQTEVEAQPQQGIAISPQYAYQRTVGIR